MNFTNKPRTKGELELAALYRIMNTVENNLGGGEGVEGLYGSIGSKNMQQIFNVMREHCGFGPDSHLLDIGAGLGRPLLHALFTERIAAASGLELDFIKCMKADAFLRQVATAASRSSICPKTLTAPLPAIKCTAVEKVKSLGPATHAYSFWEGVPVDARVAFGGMFAASRTLQCVTVVQRSMRRADPAQAMDDDYGFGPLILVDTFSVTMSGSGRSFVAYIFNKKGVELRGERAAKRVAVRATQGGVQRRAFTEQAQEAVEVAVGTPPLSNHAVDVLGSITTESDDEVCSNPYGGEVQSAEGGGGVERRRAKRLANKAARFGRVRYVESEDEQEKVEKKEVEAPVRSKRKRVGAVERVVKAKQITNVVATEKRGRGRPSKVGLQEKTKIVAKAAAPQQQQQGFVLGRVTRARPAPELFLEKISLKRIEENKVQRSPRKQLGGMKKPAFGMENKTGVAAPAPAPRGLRSSPHKATSSAMFGNIRNSTVVLASHGGAAAEEPLFDILTQANYPPTRSAVRSLAAA